MPRPNHLAPTGRNQHLLWMTPAIGCLACIVLVWGSCWALDRYYGPTRLGNGHYQLKIDGDLNGLADSPVPPTWSGTASLDRTGRWTGPVYHAVFLQRPGWDAVGLALRTKRRLELGTYPILRHDLNAAQPPDSSFDGFIMLTNRSHTFFDSDSGTVTIRRVAGGIHGQFRMYASGDPSPQVSGKRHLVLTGDFDLD
jgi:hypothetical protein